jgi:hypothetical protein
MALQCKPGLIVLAVVTLGWTLSCVGQTPEQTPPPAPENSQEQHSPQDAPTASAGEQAPDQRLPGSINGTVVDQSGAAVTGARVKLMHEDQTPSQEAISGTDGEFFFPRVDPGVFHLTITSSGFAPQTVSGTLHSAEVDTIPQVALAVATDVTEVQVGVSRVEVAEEQIKIEEKQRILGAIPNFYVTYIPNAVALTSKQKFELAWRSVVDPFTFLVVGGAAGVEQWQNHFIGYGQGAEGYAKRFGANYGDTLTGTFIGAYILPSLLKQDPRYFYKGTGSKPARFAYAIAMAFICKGDNGRWQPNYSGILGSLAAGGISNLYYPTQDRNGAKLTFENAAIGIASNGITNLLQEFAIRKLTPRLPSTDSAKP